MSTPTTKTVEVPALPGGIWTPVEPLWTAPLRLRFQASDEKWRYAPTYDCTADGDLLSMIDPAKTILGAGPVGALIGKIGGSSAGPKDGGIFLVGKHCILETKPEWKGYLYLTINDESTGFGNNSGSIHVEITIEPIP